jgi:predicted PurR-regulated permease PerM
VHSTTIPLPNDLKWRRLIVVALFLGLLYFFRGLAPVFICFVILERGLGFLADQLGQRTPLQRKGSIAAVLTALALLVAALVFVAVRKTLPLVQRLRDNGGDYLRGIFDHPSIEKLRAMVGLQGEGLSEIIKGHAGKALAYATETAHIIIFLLIGFLLAIIYLFEREDIETFVDGLTAGSVQSALARWFGYVGDAIAITVRMQLVVAVVNAVVTLPVLLLLRLPNIPMLFLLILITGLLPVVGNVIAGAVLCYVAFTSQGTWAVAVFLATTLVLHKVESYYLNPRLASQHVKLPGLVLVISLLLFEQTFGFVGLFLSFPALYVASRIANEWREETERMKPQEAA